MSGSNNTPTYPVLSGASSATGSNPAPSTSRTASASTHTTQPSAAASFVPLTFQQFADYIGLERKPQDTPELFQQRGGKMFTLPSVDPSSPIVPIAMNTMLAQQGYNYQVHGELVRLPDAPVSTSRSDESRQATVTKWYSSFADLLRPVSRAGRHTM